LNLRRLILLLAGIFLHFFIYSQEIKITTSKKALNQVLLEIRDKYDVDFSFNDQELSKYTISVSKTFKNLELALQYLLKNLPFDYQNSSGVYVIFPKKLPLVEKSKPKVYRISGRIMEAKTNEVLPFSNILVNSKGIISDFNGNFLFSTTTDSVFRIQVSHLGYMVKDTIFYRAHKNINIFLKPSEQQLQEIEIKEQLLEDFWGTENEVATIKLNHRVTKYLPGNSDNSVFNLLRLQPGVLASGEQSSDLVIWGAYAGQSRVIFDGFTVFGLKNFNDNISAINPLITRNIQLKKAGYDASYGDFVGGMVDITGKDGSTRAPHFTMGINNLTLNSLLEIPILKKSALQIAYRQTYYNLYSDGYQPFQNTDSIRNSNISDITIYPDYSFRDINAKYSFKDDNNMFYISALSGGDDFSYSINKIRSFREIIKTREEENQQTGVAAFYERKFSNKLNISLLASFSELNSSLSNQYDIFSTITGQQTNEFNFKTINNIQEKKVKLKSVYQAKKNHAFEIGLQITDNKTSLKEDSTTIRIQNSTENQSYFTFNFKDVISLKNKQINIGIRSSYLPYLNKSFIEPRLSFSHNISKSFRYNLAWGIYRQFLVKSSMIDEFGNYQYNWVIADDDAVPVLNSYHYVGGISYGKNDFYVSLDGFYKTTTGLSRYFRFRTNQNQNSGQGQGLKQILEDGIFYGDAYSYGFDFYTKYNFSGHTFWLSYTWSKSMEHFQYMRDDTYLFAPQDQRHEIKLAAIINLSPVYLSANYVYGSGFLERPYIQVFDDNRVPYSRLDVSGTYRLKTRRFETEFGVSILNVLDTQNQKFSNFEKIPITEMSSASIYFEAVPFTPTIFLKLKF
jgi:hypothetical protein